jgi:hypothetical protein
MLKEDNAVDDRFINDEDWEASIQLAEDLSPDPTGQKGEWDSARKLAKNLVQEQDQAVIDFNAPGLSAEEKMELIGQAARAAVEKFEAERQKEEMLEKMEKLKRSEMKNALERNGVNGFTANPNSKHSSAKTEGTQDLAISNIDDYEQMTVAMLKDILRKRGLKLSGRKAELIERLLKDDA